MDTVLGEHLKTFVERLTGEQFQTFAEYLFTKKFNGSFQSLRHQRDRGCDGIIEDRTVVAIYAPGNGRNSLSNFKKKFSSDLEKYMKNWSSTYPEFMFVYNSSFTGKMIEYINALHRNTKKMDEISIVEMVDGLTYTKRFEIVRHLGIPDEYFTVDLLTEVVDDLIRNGDEYDTPPLIKPMYIEDKIELNYDLSDVDAVKEEYDDTLPNIRKIQTILRDYESGDITALKNKVRSLYRRLDGSFKDKFETLTDSLSEKRGGGDDDVYRSAVRAVLLFMFEICIIGRRTIS